MQKLALIVGKIIYKLLKLTGKRGGSLPGKIAIKICPDLLKYFTYPKTTILVTGTNGKTSTTNMIAQIFAKTGQKTITNSRGDNIINGISSLLIKNSALNFKVNAKILVLEVDELTLAKYLPMINSSDVVVTNFFRDQLDRSGEMETIITKIELALQNYTGRLFLNQDDPNVKRLLLKAKANQIISFGLDLKSDKTQKDAQEGKFCPVCKAPIVYESHVYSHLGKYACKNCDFGWSEPEFYAKNIDLQKMNVNGQDYYFSFDATYHVYNTLCAVAVAKTYAIETDLINAVTKNFALGIGRMEKITIAGRALLLNLVKNPTGTNEIIKYIEKHQGKKALLLLLNDNHADGTDVSWIWDVNFEDLTDVEKIITTGKRSYDMALRFKLSQITQSIDVKNYHNDAISELLSCKDCELYVISTYTGLFTLRDELLAFDK